MIDRLIRRWFGVNPRHAAKRREKAELRRTLLRVHVTETTMPLMSARRRRRRAT